MKIARLAGVASLCVLGCGGGLGPAGDGGATDGAGVDGEAGSCDATPSGRVSLPADDGRHGDPIEWWYWTGHLQAADGRWFGFEQTFFRGEQDGIKGQMAHHAITDVAAGMFEHRVAEQAGEPAEVPDGFDLALDGLTAEGGGGHDRLHGDTGVYALDLQLDAVKAPVLQHGVGYTDYSFGGYTYYYSRERMAAQGTLVVGGERLPVTGAAWFDHQWGDMTQAVNDGWDWFGVQLDDRREIMLYVVRAAGAHVLVGGSLSGADCTVSEIGPDAFKETALGSWTSPASGCTYPMGWTLEVAGMTLTLTPVLPDQELADSPVKYWEGAAEVAGDARGRAYVELTGYCP